MIRVYALVTHGETSDGDAVDENRGSSAHRRLDLRVDEL
jgi:hypothetical protein